jgi:hypothetical protein
MSMDQATFADRQKCPKCQIPGESILATVHRDRAKTYSITCHNDRCSWFQINWLVDVNPDGSLPVVRPHKKAYPKMPDLTDRVQAAADAEIMRSLEKRAR